MGFPSVKKFLSGLINISLEEIQADTSAFIPDIFETPWTAADRNEITGYLNGLTVADSLDDRDDE